MVFITFTSHLWGMWDAFGKFLEFGVRRLEHESRLIICLTLGEKLGSLNLSFVVCGMKIISLLSDREILRIDHPSLLRRLWAGLDLWWFSWSHSLHEWVSESWTADAEAHVPTLVIDGATVWSQVPWIPGYFLYPSAVLTHHSEQKLCQEKKSPGSKVA